MIREAESKDLPRLLEMSEAFWTAGGPVDGFDKGYTKSKLTRLLDDALILVDNDVQSMLILLFNEHLCVPKVNVCELAWYVEPAARSTGVGMSLLKEGIRIAKESNAETMTLAFMEKSMPNVIKSIYENLGFELSETSYIKRL